MKIAVKYQFQNPDKPNEVSANSIWQKLSINDADQAAYEAMEYDVMTEAEYLETSKNGNKSAGTYSYLNKTIKERMEFSQNLIEELKRENMIGGINMMQALWMHHKLRALPVNIGGTIVGGVFVGGINFTIDLLNLVISGDVEVACVALQNCLVDDMSQTYHWLSDAQRNKIVAKLKAYLGWL